MASRTGVFERRGQDEVSASTFFLSLGIVLVWGLGVTALVADHVAKSGFQPGWMEIIVIGILIPFAGIWLGLYSDDPVFSFIGFNMVSIPFGVILAPILNHYSPDIIRNAFMATACVTATMMCIGTLFPEFFSQLGGVLAASLLGLIVVRVLQMFIPALAHMKMFDWIAAGIFSLYIGYDWYRATHIPKTIDNAIDVALGIYLDIINLFISLLRIMDSDD